MESRKWAPESSRAWSSFFCEVSLQYRQLASIVPRAARGALIESLAHLPDARGLDGTRAMRQVEARLVPVEAAECDQSLRRRARLAHQRIVIEIQDVLAVEGFPVRHQTAVLPEVVTDVHQVERVAHPLIQVQKENRQTGVERVARRVHDPGVREQTLDKAQV